MSRGQISDAKLSQLSRKLPDIADLTNRVGRLSSDLVSMRFGPGSRIPIAGVCLNDSVSLINDAIYALREAFAHEVWYREESSTPNDATANYFMKFYCDDAALRMYAAAEHLASAIVEMLEIEYKLLKQERLKSTSLASLVGNHLIRKQPTHLITSAVVKLVNSKGWTRSMDYRNKWVHEQPPMLSGFGIQWHRRERWQEIETGDAVTGHKLSFGGKGDKPDYSVQELRSFVEEGLFSLVQTFSDVTDYFIELLAANGISLTNTGMTGIFP